MTDDSSWWYSRAKLSIKAISCTIWPDCRNPATLQDSLDMNSSSTYHRWHEESRQPCVEEGQRRLEEVIDCKREGKRVGKAMVKSMGE
jgi:hypothetical protein